MERDSMMLEVYRMYKNPRSMEFDEKKERSKYEEFEMIMDVDGKMLEIPNGHQIGLVCIYADEKKMERYDVAYGKGFKNLSFFLEEMLKETGVILIREQFGNAQKANEKQIKSIKNFQEKGLLKKPFILKEYNFDGDFNNPKTNLI